VENRHKLCNTKQTIQRHKKFLPGKLLHGENGSLVKFVNYAPVSSQDDCVLSLGPTSLQNHHGLDFKEVNGNTGSHKVG